MEKLIETNIYLRPEDKEPIPISRLRILARMYKLIEDEEEPPMTFFVSLGNYMSKPTGGIYVICKGTEIDEKIESILPKEVEYDNKLAFATSLPEKFELNTFYSMEELENSKNFTMEKRRVIDKRYKL